jgi:5-methylcytosine-specific restriction endonuclease McrA
LKPSLKAGALFPQAARSSFVALSGSRYHSMVDRAQKKKILPPPFTLEQFREHLVKAMGGKEDGAFQCRYCRRWFTFQEIAIDHAVPLSRGGGQGLENLDFPCQPCNQRKGSLAPAVYLRLLDFLETWHPLDRQDVLSRLEKANKLAAMARRGQMLAAKLEGKAPKKEKPLPSDDLGCCRRSTPAFRPKPRSSLPI